MRWAVIMASASWCLLPWGTSARTLDCELILVGRQDDAIECGVARRAVLPDRLSIHHASQTVEMDELPSRALRGKKDSSMRVAIDLVKRVMQRPA
jgi:glycerol-3-phosphate acyltransferase PlsX